MLNKKLTSHQLVLLHHHMIHIDPFLVDSARILSALFTMENDPQKLIFRVTPWIFLLVLPLLYVEVLWRNNIQFQKRLHYISGGKAILSITVEEKQDSLDFLLSRLTKGEEQKKLKASGFACDTAVHSKHCVTNQPVQIDTRTMTVTIPSNQTVQETIIRPYARQEDGVLLKTITPVRILHGNTTPPVCEYNHQVPAVIFSSSGFTGNVFHEFNEIIIPLFITTRLFKSRVLFIVEDYKPSFVTKYDKILSQLTNHEILNPASNQSVHCFPAAVVGLKFHWHLSLNSSDIPGGFSMRNFKQFLRESLNLKYSHVSQIRKPTVMLISRTKTRRIINEDEIVGMMEELGFRVIVVSRAKVISNLELFSGMINSCSVLVGAHGAGLTNEIFLADGAVLVQLDLIGLDWAARTYYGNPARKMEVHYLRYKIEAEESSLVRVFGSKNHTAIRDPKGAFHPDIGKEVYLNSQNVKVDVARFRGTMVEAMSLL